MYVCMYVCMYNIRGIVSICVHVYICAYVHVCMYVRLHICMCLTIYLSMYKGLRILSRYYSCQDSEFRSAMETSSVDIDKLLSKNFFLWIQCPKISLRLFKDGADLRMESFSCKQSPHTLLLGANGFTLFTTCHETLKLMFFFFNFQT